MKETQLSIALWAYETFGAATDIRSATRANEEMAELLKEVASGHYALAARELADVVICLYRLAENLDVDLHAEVDRKMAVNRARKWKLDGAGCGYRVGR